MVNGRKNTNLTNLHAQLQSLIFKKKIKKSMPTYPFCLCSMKLWNKKYLS